MRSSRAPRAINAFRAALLIGAPLALLIPAMAVAQEASDSVSSLEVVAATPLPGSGIAISKVAGPVQTFSAEKIDASNALDLSRFLERKAAGVYVNDVQNNPLQPDINYRGYTASPLLGTPQGISVYMDGVRLNQPFGDVVSWDLIPRMAIDQLTLVPGSDPIFGLNTLGGALVIRSKSGLTAPGTKFIVAGGDNSSRRGEIETGGSHDEFNWYGNLNSFKTDGWRDASPARAVQGFGKLGWRNEVADLALSLSSADTDLNGNGLQDQRLLAQDYSSVYTKPDNTKNKSTLANLTGSYRLTDAITLSGNAYSRTIKTRTYNGDLNDEALGESLYQTATCTSAGSTSLPMSSGCQARARVIAAGFSIPLVSTVAETLANTPFPFIACIANATLPVPATPSTAGHGEAYEKCDGLINRSRNSQDDSGLSGQLTYNGDFAGRPATLIAGAAYSANAARFGQTTQFGFIRSDRSIGAAVGPLAFADGTVENDDQELIDNRVDMRGETRAGSVYATGTFDVASGVSLTVAGRYDSTKISNIDFITPSGPGSITAHHSFDRFNPAISVNWQADPALTLYAGYSEASRAPTAVELGCSDPANPCRLPNALAGDPPLNQVITKSLDAGARFSFGPLHYMFDAFRSDNDDDILFVADDTSGNGYFKNFGETRRQGFSVGLNGVIGKFTLGANYNYLDATYRSAETVGGVGNSTSVIEGCSTNTDPCTGTEVEISGSGQEGVIDIRPGDHIPLVPRNVFKVNLDWQVTPDFHLGLDASSIGSSFVRGNENNQHQPDGGYYLGDGRIPGYTVVNLAADYKPYKQVTFFVEVNNLLDRQYYTAGQLGFTGFNAAGAPNFRPFAPLATPPFGAERPQQGVTFYSPGAPRAIWVGMKVALGG